MAEHQKYQLQQQQHGGGEGIESILPERGPSSSQVLAVVGLLPLGGTLLGLAGITLVGTLMGLAVMTPLFIICSPVLVPAALVIGLAVLGLLTSGALGITALSSLSWMVNYFRRMRAALPRRMEQAKRKAQDTEGQVGQNAREEGQAAQSKAQEVTRGHEGGRT